MDKKIKDLILKATNANDVALTELIQPLWSNYGELLRVHLTGGDTKSIILKHIKIPEEQMHPKGFNTELSKERKIRSYQVETNWYENYNSINLQDNSSITPKTLTSFQHDGEYLILLEDLDSAGFEKRVMDATYDEIKLVISWLASFHAKFMNVTPQGLWETGTYWHLETRPDELSRTEDPLLRRLAHLIDQKLESANFQTIVHGDAKIANFCFSNNSTKVAAVDFQYVGGGCGMKDLAYFVGSCLGEDQCEEYEAEILDIYFSELKKFLKSTDIDSDAVEKEWRDLYHVAWADFHRFLKGWSPSHWKINTYSERVTSEVMSSILEELLGVAKKACFEAGSLIRKYWQNEFNVSSKKGSTEASSVVTEVDLLSQKMILSILESSIGKYDLGLLAEEDDDDQSRLKKDFFWAVDPLDGTQYFSEGKTGFSVAITLISRDGTPFIGVVYDPAKDELFHAVLGGGSYKNGEQIFIPKSYPTDERLKLFADRSMKSVKNYQVLKEKFDIRFTGGAVMNTITILQNPNSCYLKYPKKETGGCAIWDLAGVSLILKEAGGKMTSLDGSPLSFNSSTTIYFNREGVFAYGDTAILKVVQSDLSFNS